MSLIVNVGLTLRAWNANLSGRFGALNGIFSGFEDFFGFEVIFDDFPPI